MTIAVRDSQAGVTLIAILTGVTTLSAANFEIVA